MLRDVSHDKPGDSALDAPATGKQLARQQAIRQIERRRRFRMRATIGTLLMIVLTVSWVFAEYHNAGGWPTHGFSQSNSGWGHPNVWNPWIIWPAMVWMLWTAGDAWRTFGRKPISESEIRREIDRQAGQRR